MYHILIELDMCLLCVIYFLLYEIREGLQNLEQLRRGFVQNMVHLLCIIYFFN